MLDQMATARSVMSGSVSKTPTAVRTGAHKDPKGHWRAYLERKGLKTTQQREAIVDAFLRSSGHVALEDLLSSARRKHPSVGLATVYRTVKLLEEAVMGEVSHVSPGNTQNQIFHGEGSTQHPAT